jgi:hypothetical protein
VHFLPKHRFQEEEKKRIDATPKAEEEDGAGGAPERTAADQPELKARADQRPKIVRV